MSMQMSSQKIITKEMRTLLLEIGLMGYSGGCESEAIAYFYKLRLLDSDKPHASLLLAQLHFYNREFEQAEQILLDVELSSVGSDAWCSQIIQELRQSGIELSRCKDA